MGFKLSTKDWLKVFLSICLLVIVGIKVLITSDNIILLSGGSVSVSSNEEMQGANIVVMLISGALLPGICEEFLYRKVPQCLGGVTIEILSSLAFIANHQGLASVINAAVLSFFSILILYKTRKISICIGAHVLFNCSILLESNVFHLFGVDKILKLVSNRVEHIMLVVVLISCMFFMLFATMAFNYERCDFTLKQTEKLSRKQKAVFVMVVLFFAAIIIYNLL